MRVIDTTGWPLIERTFKTRELGKFRGVSINDPHFSIHNPPAYKQEYWEIQKDAISSVFRFAEKNGVDAILWSGDVFNLKSAQRNPHGFISQLIELMQTTTIPHFAIAGNHDIKFGNLEQGLPGQPIEILFQAGIFQLLDKYEAVFDAGDHKTKISGASYRHGYAETARSKKKGSADWLVVLGHFWFGPQSGDFYGEPIFGPDYLQQESEVDLYIIGHHHEDQGVQRVGEKLYASVGSISRTGAHKNDLIRQPAALYFETTALGITDHRVLRPKMPKVEDIMDLEKRAQIVAERKEMQTFIESLQTTEIISVDPKDVLASSEFDQPTKDLVLSYLEKAEGN